jgi:UDP-N-acetylmuramyl pentapeptide phosphotransferase/UDP-N-acetylglucosamine-1-phosphate transferase
MLAYSALGGVLPLLVVAILTALATGLAIPPMMPLLRRYALARPNARSSHRVPTPQGGGMAIVAVWLVALVAILALPGQDADERLSLATLAGALLVLALLGGVDDVRPLPALPRLLFQVAAVAATVWALPPAVRILPDLVPVAVERVTLLLALVWFVNLTNFMDGLDWITAAGFVPMGAALALLAALGAAPVAAGIAGALLLGGLIGFAPFNRPVARLFLGDVGSLPLGLLAGYGLVRLAGDGHLAAAVILPLYHAADATVTLLRRLAAGERVWDAHRSHFYQRATVNGYAVTGVVGRVLAVATLLAVVGALVALAPSSLRIALGLLVAAAATGAVLLAFGTRRDP